MTRDRVDIRRNERDLKSTRHLSGLDSGKKKFGGKLHLKIIHKVKEAPNDYIYIYIYIYKEKKKQFHMSLDD